MRKGLKHVCEKEHSNGVFADVEDLPQSQRARARHVCAACAYEAGYRAGVRDAKRSVRAAEAIDRAR